MLRQLLAIFLKYALMAYALLFILPRSAIILILIVAFACGLCESALKVLGILLKRDILYIIAGISLISPFLLRHLDIEISSVATAHCSAIEILTVLLVTVVSSFLGWLALASIIDPLWKTRFHPPPTSSKMISCPLEVTSVTVGLALSGGGYRAGLMHAGVLSALERVEIRPTHISAVSGGSIIGAFYAAGGCLSDFVNAVVDGSLDGKRQLFRLQNIVTLLFRRSRAQAELLDSILLNGISMSDLLSEQRPRIIFCTTDLYSGSGLGITHNFTVSQDPPAPWNAHPFENIPQRYPVPTFYFNAPPGFGDDTLVSSIVAASGAFPLAFDAVPVRSMLLSDGGLHDNSGVKVILETHLGSTFPAFESYNSCLDVPGLADWHLDYILSSEAGALFTSHDESTFPKGIGRSMAQFSRALDVIYRSVGGGKYALDNAPLSHLLSPAKLFRDFRMGAMPSYGLFKDDDPLIMLPCELFSSSNFEEAIDILPEEDIIDEGASKRVQANRIDGDLRAPRALGRSLLESFRTVPVFGSRLSEQALQRLLLYDLFRCLMEFRAASTLKACYTRAQAERIFRLGQYLVVIGVKDIRKDIAWLAVRKEKHNGIWKRLLQASGVTLSTIEQKSLTIETGFYELSSGRNACTIRLPLREFKMDASGEEEILSALLAHRLAHILRNRESGVARIPFRSSLLDELRQRIEFDLTEEALLDRNLVELLQRAGFSLNGGVAAIKLVMRQGRTLGGASVLRDRLLVMRNAVRNASASRTAPTDSSMPRSDIVEG